jgi:CDP-diacylglycerol--glycerol-3-phosphate 3-phosphatidyltransferase
MQNNKVLTVPNLLTLIRLILVPVFIYVYLNVGAIEGLIIFVVANITDILDGYIARRFNQISDLGKLFDPLADKLIRISAVVVFVINGVLPIWVLVIFIIFDSYLVLNGLVLLKYKFVAASNWSGKLAMAVSSSGLILCFFERWISPFHLIVTYMGLITLAISVYVYGKRSYKVIKNSKQSRS